MTIQEFDATKWSVGMKVKVLSGLWKDRTFYVDTVDFDQKLIGVEVNKDDGFTTWLRCENCKLIEEG